MAAVEALWKDQEDTRREVEEERLVATMTENICDAKQAKAAHLRTELEGMGHSLSFLLPTDATYGLCSWHSVLMPHALFDAESRMEVRCLTEQLRGAQEEAGRLRARLES